MSLSYRPKRTVSSPPTTFTSKAVFSNNNNNNGSKQNQIFASSDTSKLPPITNVPRQQQQQQSAKVFRSSSSSSSSIKFSSSSSSSPAPSTLSSENVSLRRQPQSSNSLVGGSKTSVVVPASKSPSSSSSSVSQTQSLFKQKLLKHYQSFDPNDKRPILTVEVDNDENSVFASLADLLFSNNSSTSHKTEAKWINSRVKIHNNNNKNNTHHHKTIRTSSGSHNNPCCIQLSGINLYLGAKPTTERLVTEAAIVCNRVKRNGGILPVCSHMSKKDSISDSEYTTYPNRIIVAFFPGTKPITLKANMAKSLCDHFGTAFTFAHICPETYIVIPRKELISDNFSGGNTSTNTILNDQRGSWLKAMCAARSPQELLWIAKVSHGAKGRQMKIIDGRMTTNSIIMSQQGSSTSTSSSDTLGNVGGGHDSSSPLSVDPQLFLTQLDRSLDSHAWVVQRYVTRPLLYNGRKFDLRAWVLLTPRLEIFLYKEGVCRMCSVAYDDSSFGDVFAHLSNNCVQEKHPGFGKLEKGNLLSFDELNDRLISKMKRSEVVVGTTRQVHQAQQQSESTSSGINNNNNKLFSSASLSPLSSSEAPQHTFMSFNQDVVPQMKRIIGNCFSSIKQQILPVYEQGAIDAFQYFGFDFMLDSSMKLWLLEVNGAAGVADYLLKPTVEDLAETVIYDMLPQARPKKNNNHQDEDRKGKRPNWFEKIFAKDEW